jgi:hypothetical protein
MNLKNTLGQIEADGGNLHGGWLLCSGCLTANPFWHSDAGSGSHPPHPLSEANLAEADIPRMECIRSLRTLGEP